MAPRPGNAAKIEVIADVVHTTRAARRPTLSLPRLGRPGITRIDDDGIWSISPGWWQRR